MVPARTTRTGLAQSGTLPPAHWELAKEIVKLRDAYSPKTLIFGNGDVQSVKEARELAKKTGLDGVMIGRGLLGNPWFFCDKKPTITERLNAIVEHAEIFEGNNFESMKKHFHAYTRGFRGAKELREQLMKVKTYAETKRVVENFIAHHQKIA